MDYSDADKALILKFAGVDWEPKDDPPYRTRFLTKLAEVQNAN